MADEVSARCRLKSSGAWQVPDFIVNRMGIVNCANESYGRVGRLGDHMDDPAIARHLGRDWDNAVFNVTQNVLRRAKEQGISNGSAANTLADECARRPSRPMRSAMLRFVARRGCLTTAGALSRRYAAIEHPIWGHRSQAIINSLLRDEWHLMPQA